MSSSPYGRSGAYADPSQAFAVVSQASLADRLGFIRKTYLHLAVAIALFAILEFVLLNVFAAQLPTWITAISGMGWLVVLGAYMVVSWVAERWAKSSTSLGMQYAGLGLFTVAEAAIFLPLLYIANTYFAGTIASAAVVTGIVFAGLTIVVFVTQADFSFLRMALSVGGLAAFAFIIVAMVFQLPILGALFSTAMIVLASGYILYQTSNVVHHYRTDQHVAASLALFASVALLFWYVLQLFMSLQRD